MFASGLQVVLFVENSVVTLFGCDLACFFVQTEQPVRHDIDHHQRRHFRGLRFRIRTADDIDAACHFGVFHFMNISMEFCEIILRHLAALEILRKRKVGIIMFASGDFQNCFGIFSLEHGVFNAFIVVELFVEFRHGAMKVGKHERRRQMRNHRGVRTAFGDDGFTDVVDRIKIEMRHVADENVWPVVVRQGDLLPRRELQASVCAEVHDGVGVETIAKPEIRRDIGMRRRHFHAMNDL